MTHVSVTVNGAMREADVEPRTLLVYFLRETLGLTGTNVGCDTSSCGACTVLLDGESVKSCTLLAAQADGRELTTIEGLAEGDELHPLQESFHRNHGLQCGYCTPGMLMAAASYLKENPSPQRSRRAAGARGQPLPLHRLPEHREVDPRRGRVHGRRRDSRGRVMATTETFIGQPVLRKEDPELLTGQASYIDNWTMPGMLWMALARPPYVHATIDGVDTSEAASMPGVVGVYTAGDLELGALPFVWPITEDIKVPVHYPLASDKVRFNGDAVAVVVAETREQAIDAAEVVAVTATELPAVIDMEEAAKDEVHHPRRPGNELRRALEPRRWRRSVGVRLGSRDRPGAVRAAEADPERDRAARVSRRRRAGDGRVDPRLRHADPAHREGHALGRRPGSPSRSCA